MDNKSMQDVLFKTMHRYHRGGAWAGLGVKLGGVGLGVKLGGVGLVVGWG